MEEELYPQPGVQRALRVAARPRPGGAVLRSRALGGGRTGNGVSAPRLLPFFRGMWTIRPGRAAGSFIKGTVWGLVYRLRNSGCFRWVYRPFMSLLSTLVLSWLIIYSAATVRKSVWFRA